MRDREARAGGDVEFVDRDHAVAFGGLDPGRIAISPTRISSWVLVVMRPPRLKW